MKFDLLVNHFKIAIRSLLHQKFYSLINILGLTIGVVFCLLAYLLVHYDLTFDNFHPDGNRIYRIVGKRIWSTGDINPVTSFPSPLAVAMREEINGIGVVAPFYPLRAAVTTAGRRRFEPSEHPSVIVTGPEYFTIFHYDLIAGNIANLSHPNTVILSERSAHRYFGDLSWDKVLNLELFYNDSLRVQVGGIVKDWDRHTDFPYTDFISIATVRTSFLNNLFQLDDWHNGPGNDGNAQTLVKVDGDVQTGKCQ